ncbi:bifunctional DNA primase/polymerase [Streptomyces pristinaespiralis]|uniref:bifunctional DNA primase/polymerase n=1 Tax=Streptomyces pristinaespiralis TaxID=38300 RepID=UPI0033CDBD39
MVAHATDYAARGWHVFPLRPDDKRPAVTSWEQKATVDLERIERAWTGAYARCGIGIACGPSRLVVVDLDTSKGDTPPEEWQMPGIVDGADVLADLYGRHDDRFPFGTTPTVCTASGGLHLYFAAPEREVRNSAGKVGWKIDVRAAGGYVVAPPSTAAGLPYTWQTGPDTPPLPIPAWLLARALPPPRPVPTATVAPPRGGSLVSLIGFVLQSAPGERNSRLYWAAQKAFKHAREHGGDEAAIERALIDAALTAGLRGGETEARHTIRSAHDSRNAR